MQYSVYVRNAKLNAIEAEIGRSPVLRIRTGNVPLACRSLENGRVLAEIKLPAGWMVRAIDGEKDMAGTWKVKAQGSGIPGHFRLYDADGICHVQGTVGMNDMDDMLINISPLSAGQAFEVERFTIRDNNG